MPVPHIIVEYVHLERIYERFCEQIVHDSIPQVVELIPERIAKQMVNVPLLEISKGDVPVARKMDEIGEVVT